METKTNVFKLFPPNTSERLKRRIWVRIAMVLPLLLLSKSLKLPFSHSSVTTRNGAPANKFLNMFQRFENENCIPNPSHSSVGSPDKKICTEMWRYPNRRRLWKKKCRWLAFIPCVDAPISRRTFWWPSGSLMCFSTVSSIIREQKSSSVALAETEKTRTEVLNHATWATQPQRKPKSTKGRKTLQEHKFQSENNIDASLSSRPFRRFSCWCKPDFTFQGFDGNGGVRKRFPIAFTAQSGFTHNAELSLTQLVR